MRIYSQDVILSEVSSADRAGQVIRARDQLAASDVFFRRALEASNSASESLKTQFILHRSLSRSGVVDAHDLVLSDGVVTGFTMPVLEGSSLSEAVASLAPQALLAVLRDTALTVFSLHSLGYIHGDLTANNVWVTEKNGHPVGMLLDLGFAAQIGSRLMTEVRGTLGHIPPEASLGRSLGPASDAYSFGKMLDRSLGSLADGPIKTQLRSLSEHCTSGAEDARLSDFSAIYATLMRIARESTNPWFPHSHHLLPLRRTGLRSKIRTINDWLSKSKLGGVFWCLGDPGSGKSELMRHICHEAQERQNRTIRFTEVTVVHECIHALDSLFNRPGIGTLVFVETSPECSLDSQSVREIRELARNRQIAIVFEVHRQQISGAIQRTDMTTCRPFTFRECMHATGHLLSNRGIIVQNTEAVTAVTGGNPRKVSAVMTHYLLSGRRARGESLDFGQCDESKVMYAGLGITSKKTDAYVRSARESHSNSLLPPGNIRLRLRGCRVAIARFLSEYRTVKKSGIIKEVSLSRRISELFGELGSPRRQSRWLQAGISAYSRTPNLERSEEELSSYIIMLGLAMPPMQAIDRLGSLSNHNPGLSRRLRCMASSELGAAYLHARMVKEAQTVLHEALALSSSRGELGDLEASTLNRLGAAKMLLQDYPAARRYFTQASHLARKFDDGGTLLRVEGNLGYLTLHNAEPAVALEWFGRHRLGVLKACRYADYLSNLLNQTRCLVDLGKGLAAERRGRLAVFLGEMLSDDMRLAYALNNFGWIMSMRCNGKLAMDSFRRALAIRSMIGDDEGVAQTSLNIARLYLIARCYDHMTQFIGTATERFERLGNLEGLWDCQRILIKRSLLLSENDQAAIGLEGLLAHSDKLPPKDKADALLLRLETLLWSGNATSAADALSELEAVPAVFAVHPLSARLWMLAGLLAIDKSDLDEAHKRISRSVSMFRESNREDLLLEATTVMALLAHRMDNSAAGQRYLRYVEEMTARLAKEVH